MTAKTLDGKAVVVTGAAQGMGKAYTRAILSEGGAVVANDVDAPLLDRLSEEMSSHGDRVLVHKADITHWDQAERLIAAAVERFGALDGLVNNAGIYDVRRVEENDEATIRLLVDVNVTGSMFCGTLAARRMLEQGSGAIINTTSGALVGLPLRGIYSATKAAMAALTWSWAQDLEGTGVRVNAISPLARTRQLDVAAAYLKVDHNQLMRDISPAVNAPVVTFLLSDAAADVSGQILRINEALLTLITKPDIVRPGMTLSTQTTAEVARAFEQGLRAHMEPIGPPNWSPVGAQTAITAQVTSR